MPSQLELLKFLSGQAGGMSAQEMSEKLGVPQGNFQTQLDRFLKKQPPWAIKDEEKRYTITDDGIKSMNEMANSGDSGISEGDVGALERQQFERMGKQVGGMNADLIKVTTEHVFEGGDWKDLVWVWKGLGEMSIPKELATRWANRWRSYLERTSSLKPMPPELVKVLEMNSNSPMEAKDREKATGLRNYIVDENNTPQKVAEGEGIDYSDAVKLAIERTKASGAAANANASGDIEKAVALVKAIKEVGGGNGAGPAKPLLVIPGPNGQMELREFDPTKPVTIPGQNQPTNTDNKPKTLILKPGAGGGWELVEFDPSKPLILSPPTPANPNPNPQPSTKVIVVGADGQRKEYAPGEPIIIERAANAPPAPSGGFTFKDEAGGIQTVSYEALDQYFKVADWKNETRRKEEAHKMKLDIGSAAKDFLLKGAKVLERRMGASSTNAASPGTTQG